MSKLEIYLIMQADSFAGAGLGGIMIFMVALAAYIGLYASGYRNEDDELKSHSMSGIKRLTLGLVVCFVMATITPKTKTLVAMYAIPAMANNEDLKEIFGDSLDVAKLKLKEIKKDLENE